MSIPKKLKNMNLFNEGRSYLGVIASVTLPKLTRKMEEWRGGGMDGSVKVDLGQDALEMEWTDGGIAEQALKQYGAASVNGLMLRFAGAYQADDTGQVSAVEVTVRGRHEEIDMGDGKPGDDSESKMKTACAYYRLVIDDQPVIEIDVLNGVFIVDGVDRYAEIRTAIGL